MRYSETEKSKCQDLPKFQFSGGGEYSETEKSKCQDLPKFQFSGGGGVNCRIWTKISTTPAGSCITDSLSHTTYVETNQHSEGTIAPAKLINYIH